MGKKVTGIEKAKAKKKPATFKLLNGQVQAFRSNPGITKLMQAESLTTASKMALFKTFYSVIDSAEAKALFDTVDGIIVQHEKDNPEGPPIKWDDPKFLELFEKESGIKVSKLSVTEDEMPGNFTSENLVAVLWLVDFVEGDRG